jgi:hypothetical protein
MGDGDFQWYGWIRVLTGDFPLLTAHDVEILSARKTAITFGCGNDPLCTAALRRQSSPGIARPSEKTLSEIRFQVGLLGWFDCRGRLSPGLAALQPDVTSHTCSRKQQGPERDEKDKH